MQMLLALNHDITSSKWNSKREQRKLPRAESVRTRLERIY